MSERLQSLRIVPRWYYIILLLNKTMAEPIETSVVNYIIMMKIRK